METQGHPGQETLDEITAVPRGAGRPTNASKAAALAAAIVAEPPELNQPEQNALLDNLPNIEMMLQALTQACVLIRQKDQLERQVDILSRQLHDVRIILEREQSRLAEAKATRVEYARG